MTVLSRLLLLLFSPCQQDMTPSKKPGRKIVARFVAITRKVCSARTLYPNGEASASPLPTRERRQAAKMSRNLRVRANQQSNFSSK